MDIKGYLIVNLADELFKWGKIISKRQVKVINWNYSEILYLAYSKNFCR